MTTNPLKSSYVLITPARDEADFIEKTIQSVLVQTMQPLRWIIVSDGSTDGTDEIVEKYSSKCPWIVLVRTPVRSERHFGGKARAFAVGYQHVQDLPYAIIGNVDADTSFEPDHIEYLLGQFDRNPELGVAGTNYRERAGNTAAKYDYRFTNSEDVSGLCQMFRRECFEQIGGYQPNPQGGIDLIASIKARMYGWQTRSFDGRVAVHHRQQGTADAKELLVEFHNGRKDFLFGGHPVWELSRAIYRLVKRPYIIGGCLIVAGYYWAMLRGLEKSVSTEMMRFRRKEQMHRLRKLCLRVFA